MPNRPDISPDLEDALRKLARSVRPISDTAVRRSWTRRQHTGYQPTPHAGAYVMSYNNSTHWRARPEGMRVLAEETKGGISKYVMRRIAADYEWFARTIEQRPIRRIPIPAVVPAEVRKQTKCYQQIKGRRKRPRLIPACLFGNEPTPLRAFCVGHCVA